MGRRTGAVCPNPIAGLALQQPLSAVCVFALSACCAAVGSPCICFWLSWEEAATFPVVRFMVLVGGCSFSSRAVPALVCAVLPTVGPEPASFSAVRPVVVLHGPACAAV